MGGSAFSSLPNPLYTPRMPPVVYRRVISACKAALRELFVCVASPIEGPEKKDHGDIDILVALEKRIVFPKPRDDPVPSTPRGLMAAVQRALNAKHAIVQPSGTSANLAIQWPSDMDEHVVTHERTLGTGETVGDQGVPKAKYIQVDVRICPNIDELRWILFKHAHGDIWNLLGSTIRPFGLTVDEEALWLRIPEIEKFDRKKAKVCLSRDPVEILHFLGMKVEGFWAEPFESVDALFSYTTTCRLFHVRDTPDGEADGGANEAGVIGGEEGRKRLKANDRRRMNGRPVYRRWINEFIPQLQAEARSVGKGPGVSIEEMRAMVRDEAIARFCVGVEYRRRLTEWQLERDDEQMKSLIKVLVPSSMDPQRRACVVGALKKIIMDGDPSFGFEVPGLRNPDGSYDGDVVRSFVQDNLEEVGKVAWVKHQQRAQEAMQLKTSARKN